MSEPRAPDPTLMDHPFPVAIELTPVPTAHTLGRARNEPILPSTLAAYIAVPCRECFPDAPPPGMSPVDEFGRGPVYGDPHLSWQIP